VYQDFIFFTCNLPGTPESFCSSYIEPVLLENCTELGLVCENGFCVEGPECESDADCDDGLFCNGEETCVGGFCQAGTPVNCNDGVSCTVDSCNENTDSCDNVPNDDLCDDGLFCNGEEYCDAELGCQPGVPIDCSPFNIPGIATCTNDPDNNPFTFDFRPAFTSTCDEETDSCTIGDETISHTLETGKCGVECLSDSDCSEGEKCKEYKCIKEKEEKKKKKKAFEIDYCGDDYCDEEIGENEFNCPEDCVSVSRVGYYGAENLTEKVMRLGKEDEVFYY